MSAEKRYADAMTAAAASAELTRRFEETRRRNIGYRVRAATGIREALRVFDNEHLSVSSVDELREKLLAVAEELAPLPESAKVPARLVMAVRPTRQAPAGTAQRVMDVRNESIDQQRIK